MRRHNTVKVLLVTILILAILSWLLPAAYFQTSIAEQGRTQMGLFDLFNYPLTAISYFGYIAAFVFAVGGFYGIMHRIPAYRNLLDKIVYNLRGNEKLFLVVTMIMFALLTSVCGVQLALFIFFPFVASIILLLGYDKMVVALTLVGSTMIGMMGTTTATSNVNLLFQTLSKVEIGSAMALKIAILLIGLVLLIINTLAYVKKHSIVRASVAAKKTISTVEVKEEKVVKKTTSSSKGTKSTGSKKSSKGKKNTKKNNNKADLVDEDVIVVSEKLENGDNEFVPSVVDGTHKVWPIVLSITVMFIVLLMAFIPWGDAFGTKVFENANTGFSGIKLFVWIALLIGLLVALGLTFLITKKWKKVLEVLIWSIIAVVAGYTITAGSVTGFIILLVVMCVAHLIASKLINNSLLVSCVDLVVELMTVLIFAAATGFGSFFKPLGSFFGAKFAIFGKVFGVTPAFGTWSVNELIPMLFVVTIFLVLVYKVKFDTVLDGLKAGFRKALLPAVVVILIYSCLVIVTYHPFQLMIYKAILGWSKTFNLFATALIAILASFFNADPAYTFQSILPYFVTIIKDTSIYPKVALLFQSMYGLTMLVAPTSLILMMVLSYLGINYKDWLKNTWLFVVILLVLVLLVLAVWNAIFAYVLFALLLVVLLVLAIKKKI